MPIDFASTRAAFDLPGGVVYLDGNSLGPVPHAAKARVARCVAEEWGQHLIRAWNTCGWIDMPRRVGDRVGRLIGAAPGTTVMGDTLTVKVHQALSAALAMRPDRRVVLTDTGNFPSDLYAAETLLRHLGRGHVLRRVAPGDVAGAIGPDVAALMLTEVDYRTGRRHDMAALTAAAQDAGALAIWDLAHSAGALAVDVATAGADFAVGCSYKYLNGGPGAPAFIYVAPAHGGVADPALAGWLGHARPFAFTPDFEPAMGAARMQVGTPAVIQLAALDAALDVFDGLDMAAVAARSAVLSERFREGVAAQCPDLPLAAPREPAARGSQLSFRHPEGYAVMQALIARGVIGDFRAPDLLRFGFAPLYNTESDVDTAVAALADVLRTKAWDRSAFRTRAAVT